MFLLNTILYLATLQIISAQNCPSEGITSHVIMNDNSYRMTTLKRGNFTIQGLMTFTEYKQCDKVSKLGLIGIYAMKYAIDRININKDLIPWGSLGLQLDNVCYNLTLTMARGIEAVSLHRPNSVCRADFLKCDKSQNLSSIDVKPVTAIVGTEMSSTSIPLASLLSLYHIPQISFAASSRLLSKKDLYKSFFRTIPSDTNQISVMLQIIEKFKWNYVFAIGSDDDYGKLGISELKQEAQGRNICVAHDEYISDGSKVDSKVDEIIVKLQEEEHAEVVILFCYPWMGKKILEKAMKFGIKRVWLTSESWNPSALNLMPPNLMNLTVGIITVSLKRYPMPFLINYMRKEIAERFQCNMWLQNFLKFNFDCEPKSLSTDGLSLEGTGTGCPIKIEDIMNELSGIIQGTVYNLVDAVTVLAHGIHNYLQKKCPSSNAPCSVNKISPTELTHEIYNVSFKNEQGKEVSFNQHGDPKYAYYTVENIQFVNGSYIYKAVGDWDDKRPTNKLQLNGVKIQWPLWFSESEKKSYPSSRCSEDCQPGEHMVGKQECCWACQPCEHGKYSEVVNAISCRPCEPDYHTTDKKRCIKTQIKWLVINDAAGMAIVVISCVGILIITLAISILFKFRMLILLDDTSPHLITLCCMLVVLSFAYGLLHIIKPSQPLCQSVNALFYLFLMSYTSIVMVKTKFFTKYLIDNSKRWLCGSLLSAQVLSLFLFLLVEAASIVAWFNIDVDQVKTFKITGNNVFEKRLQCQVDTTAARYVSTFIPIIILIIATFCAFRERNMEHSFYETKFLSFTCIALCIIIVAYMPTFHYVVGKYKSVVMAITMDLFGFTFMGCLIFPKVYVAIMRYKRGSGQYPVKAVSEEKTAAENTTPENEQHAESSLNGIDNVGNIGKLQPPGMHVDASNFDEILHRSVSNDAAKPYRDDINGYVNESQDGENLNSVS